MSGESLNLVLEKLIYVSLSAIKTCMNSARRYKLEGIGICVLHVCRQEVINI